MKIGRFNIKVTFKYPINQQYWPLIEQFIPFQNWVAKWENAQLEHVTFQGLEIEDISFFGNNKIGFLKFKLDARWSDGKPLPGIVFMRGDAVAVLLILTDDASNKFVLLVKQPRVPVSSMDFLELPAGMVDDEKNFHSAALKELKEECGLEIMPEEMLELGSSQEGYAVSPGGSDEYLTLFLVEKQVSVDELKDLQGRLGGLRDEGERIQIELVKFSDVIGKTRSLSVLAAIALYNNRR